MCEPEYATYAGRRCSVRCERPTGAWCRCGMVTSCMGIEFATLLWVTDEPIMTKSGLLRHS